MVNKVILIGNIGGDVETYTVQSSGSTYARFSLATSESWKTRETGEQHQETQWHSIVAWRDLATHAAAMLKKGSRVYVEGKIKYGKYTAQDGTEKHTTTIEASTFRLLEKRETTDQQGETRQAQPQAAKQAATQPAYNTDKADGDDLPF